MLTRYGRRISRGMKHHPLVITAGVVKCAVLLATIVGITWIGASTLDSADRELAVHSGSAARLSAANGSLDTHDLPVMQGHHPEPDAQANTASLRATRR